MSVVQVASVGRVGVCVLRVLFGVVGKIVGGVFKVLTAVLSVGIRSRVMAEFFAGVIMVGVVLGVLGYGG